MTLAFGLTAHRTSLRTLLLAATGIMVATGLGFASIIWFWPLMVVAVLGTLNPSAGDVSVFLPTEQALLPSTVSDRYRTALYEGFALLAALLPASQTVPQCNNQLFKKMNHRKESMRGGLTISVTTTEGLGRENSYPGGPGSHPTLQGWAKGGRLPRCADTSLMRGVPYRSAAQRALGGNKGDALPCSWKR
jgi:hypothetical protein